MAKDRKIDMVILGFLAHGSCTGYDIKKRIDSSISFFWKGSFGSIYPALTKLEEDGLITRSEPSGHSAREKILYTITDEGRDELAGWISAEQATNDLKYETMMKVFFGGGEDRQVTIRNIKLFEENVSRDLSILRAYKENLETVLNDPGHMNFYLTVLFGIRTYEAHLKWCGEAVRLLKA